MKNSELKTWFIPKSQLIMRQVCHVLDTRSQRPLPLPNLPCPEGEAVWHFCFVPPSHCEGHKGNSQRGRCLSVCISAGRHIKKIWPPQHQGKILIEAYPFGIEACRLEFVLACLQLWCSQGVIIRSATFSWRTLGTSPVDWSKASDTKPGWVGSWKSWSPVWSYQYLYFLH